MEADTAAASLGSSLLVATMKASKLTELRAILGRMLALSYRAQFCITFTKAVTFVYVYHPELLQTRIVCELTNANFFESFNTSQSVLTFTTAALKELYWFVGLNSPVVGYCVTYRPRTSRSVSKEKKKDRRSWIHSLC